MADSKYSFNSTIKFLINNFGIIFVAIIFSIGGFFIGTLRMENKAIKEDEHIVQEEPTEKVAGVIDEKNDLDKMAEISENDHVQGAENPKISLIVYSDYECPFCQRFHSTMEQIIEKYSDQIAYVFRHYPLSFHPNSQQAAEAAECVASQSGNDAFWKYTNEIFAQNEKLSGKLSPDAIDIAIKASGADSNIAKIVLKVGR